MKRWPINIQGLLVKISGPFSTECFVGHHKYRISIDESGWRRGHIGKSRIFFVGDSFIFGLGVEDYETLPVLVQKKMNVGAINMGIPGSGLQQLIGVVNNMDFGVVDPIVIHVVTYSHPKRFADTGGWGILYSAAGIPQLNIHRDNFELVERIEWPWIFWDLLSRKPRSHLAALFLKMQRNTLPNIDEINKYNAGANLITAQFFNKYPRGRLIFLYWPLAGARDFDQIWSKMSLDSRIEKIDLPENLPRLINGEGLLDHPSPEAYSQVASLIEDYLQRRKH